MSESVGSPIDLAWIRAGTCFIILILALAACVNDEAGSDIDPDAEPSATAPNPTVVGGTGTFTPNDPPPSPFLRPTSVGSPTVTPMPLAILAVIDRAAADRDVSPAAIELLAYNAATWSSTALGCPEPGRSYAQIVTSGYEVILGILGEQAVYHVDQNGTAIVECEGASLEP
ncbi:hypothetical protein BH23CHL2_BH23CHL2_22700 [soil metagenome]